MQAQCRYIAVYCSQHLTFTILWENSAGNKLIPLSCWIKDAMPTSNFQPIRLLTPDCWYKFNYIEWQTVQIQIIWLLQKPTDLDLHCLQRQGYLESAGIRVNIFLLFFFQKYWTWYFMQIVSIGNSGKNRKKWNISTCRLLKILPSMLSL